MKKIAILLVFLGFGSISAIAATNNQNNIDQSGVYLGAQLGATDMHYDKNGFKHVENVKFAGRAYLGYAFSEYVSTELGYIYFGKPKFKAEGFRADFLQQGADLVAKASLPLAHGFGFYIKGGLAYIWRGSIRTNFGGHGSSNKKFAPTAGAGVSYHLYKGLYSDASWFRVFRNGSLPKVDFFGLGLFYKF